MGICDSILRNGICGIWPLALYGLSQIREGVVIYITHQSRDTAIGRVVEQERQLDLMTSPSGSGTTDLRDMTT
jgi:hypothetical protein